LGCTCSCSAGLASCTVPKLAVRTSLASGACLPRACLKLGCASGCFCSNMLARLRSPPARLGWA
jgi:hypothetical protein